MNCMQNAHDLVFVTAHPCGDEEWFCPHCGEHFVLCMPLRPCERPPLPRALTWDDSSLAPWKAFLERLG
jgi:hypothetical protein